MPKKYKYGRPLTEASGANLRAARHEAWRKDYVAKTVQAGFCAYDGHGTLPCARHQAEADAAAEAAEKQHWERMDALRADGRSPDLRHQARSATGARTYAYQRALQRPLSDCTGGRVERRGDDWNWYASVDHVPKNQRRGADVTPFGVWVQI